MPVPCVEGRVPARRLDASDRVRRDSGGSAACPDAARIWAPPTPDESRLDGLSASGGAQDFRPHFRGAAAERVAGGSRSARAPRPGVPIGTNAPGWIRTTDRRIRNPVLYPAELPAPRPPGGRPVRTDRNGSGGLRPRGTAARAAVAGPGSVSPGGWRAERRFRSLSAGWISRRRTRRGWGRRRCGRAGGRAGARWREGS